MVNRLIFAALTLSCLLSAQNRTNTAVSKPTLFTNSFQLTPQAMPSSLTNIATLTGGPITGHDVYICEADFTSKGTASTITLQDGQGTPVPLLYQVALAANAANLLLSAPQVQSCRWFPGGASVQAGGANLVWMYISGYWR